MSKIIKKALGFTLIISSPLIYAQEGVTLYGTIDTGIGWTHVSNGEKKTRALDNGQADSLWGLRGSEALSNGFTVHFNLESGFNPSTGKAEEEGKLFNYAAWIGVENETFGAFRLGRQNPIAQQFGEELEIAPWADFGFGALFKASDNYQLSDSISYVTPSLSGIQAGVSYSFNANEGDQPQTSHNARAMSAGLRYENGPFYATLTYDQLQLGHDRLPGERAAKAWQLGASYDFTDFKLAGGWSQQRHGFVGLNGGDVGDNSFGLSGLEGIGPLEFAQGGRVNAWFAGASLPVGQGEFLAQWSMANPNWTWESTGKRAKKVHIYSLGYVYELSPRTSLYAFAAEGRHFSLEDTFNQDNAKVRRVAAGLTHSF